MSYVNLILLHVVITYLACMGQENGIILLNKRANNVFQLVPTARSKTSSTEDKDEDAYPSGKPNENSLEEETDTSAEVVQPIMTYSILDQSILNWPTIQVT